MEISGKITNVVDTVNEENVPWKEKQKTEKGKL